MKRISNYPNQWRAKTTATIKRPKNLRTAIMNICRFWVSFLGLLQQILTEVECARDHALTCVFSEQGREVRPVTPQSMAKEVTNLD